MSSCMFELNKIGSEGVILFGRYKLNIQLFTVFNCYNKLIGKFGAATVTERIFNERNLLNCYTIEILLSTPDAQPILQLCGKLF